MQKYKTDTDIKVDLSAGTMTIDRRMVAELSIPSNTKTHKDKKTGARTIALPARLPDGAASVVMLCRLEDEEWKPATEIEKIVIHFK